MTAATAKAICSDGAKVVSFFEKTKFSEKKALSSRPIMKKDTRFVASIGVFDGVHRGHRFLLDRVKEEATARGMSTLAVTFDPTPATFFRSGASCKQDTNLLLTARERRERLLDAGMDSVEVMTFDRKVAEMTAADFMMQLKELFGVSVLVMGYDHRFGCEQQTNKTFYTRAAQTCGMEIVHAAAWGDVSSSRIREMLLRGDVEGANDLLGYPYPISGTVITGDGRGRKLGFPTANLAVDSAKLIPATGVYAVSVRLEENTYKGMMNIGLCPTFGGRTERRIEVHILDFDADIYGQTLNVQLLRRLRDEQKFPSINALTEQLRADAETIKKLESRN